jgi:hypothetical protein
MRRGGRQVDQGSVAGLCVLVGSRAATALGGVAAICRRVFTPPLVQRGV